MSHFRVIEHVARAQHIREWPNGVELGHEGSLVLVAKQYIPRNNSEPGPTDVTIVGAHANGFPKELYEPLWDDLYEQMELKGRRLRGIWIADVVNQGVSGVHNEISLGDDPSWSDHARDLLSLINQHQDQMPAPIIGIGHSMGGMHLADLSLLHPRLFQALILIDPVIQRENPSKPYALASAYRRDKWPTRADAAEKFRASNFYQKWDPRVLDKWINYGLREIPTEVYPQTCNDTGTAVTLVTSKAQEAFTFLRPAYGAAGTPEGDELSYEDVHLDDIKDNYPFYRPEPPRVFRRLPEIKPSVLYIFGEQSELASPTARQDKMELTGSGVGGSGGRLHDRVKQTVLPCGHLIPMERVMECAISSASFIHDELTRWEAEVKALKQRRKQSPRSERIVISERWRDKLGVPLSKSRDVLGAKI